VARWTGAFSSSAPALARHTPSLWGNGKRDGQTPSPTKAGADETWLPQWAMRSFHGRPTGVSHSSRRWFETNDLALDEISRKPSGAARLGLEGVDRLRGMRHQKARRYVEVVRQRHSAAIAANKLSVAKRTGKFSTWSDDAATQQVAAKRERTVSSSTDLFSTTWLLLDVDMATTPELSQPSCASL